jgi:hypothetical protein
MKFKTLAALVACLLVTSSPAQADGKKSLCIYDPGGREGDAFTMLQAYRDAALEWGVDFEFKPYTDEATATNDFEAGQCDAVFATGVRLQRFNRSAFTLEAIGALPSYGTMKAAVQSIAKYGAAYMSNGNYETAGIMPGGAVYLFVRDRNLDSVEELVGKCIATMNFDKAAPVMVQRVGATVASADIGTFGALFNNGEVDACYTSAVAFSPFELAKGLDAEGGGIVRYPLSQLTFQVVLHADRFPEGFGAKSRTFSATQFDTALSFVKRAEDAIPSKYWMEIDEAQLPAFEELFLDVRLELADEHGAYDRGMLKAMRKVRCSRDAARAECADPKE